MANVNDDQSADTARFQAFVQRQDEEPPQPWQMRAPASRVGLLAGVVVVVAAVVALLAFTLT